MKERKLKQADTDIAFDTMRLYRIPKKKANETGVVAKGDPVVGGAEFDQSAERLFQTTVLVREKKGARKGTWSQELASKENNPKQALDSLRMNTESQEGLENKIKKLQKALDEKEKVVKEMQSERAKVDDHLKQVPPQRFISSH